MGNDTVATKGGNANLASEGRAHGIDAFINKNPSQGSQISPGLMAQTIEAIGTVWLDSKSLAAVGAVMQALNLE